MWIREALTGPMKSMDSRTVPVETPSTLQLLQSHFIFPKRSEEEKKAQGWSRERRGESKRVGAREI